ncbi:PHA/PHB synthase family protein [Henriciella aquimarina]|uniref:PHA/PHB synthase family protein n=1 Tax=Henriciella aquimarina TaxID=545261 RepID=UPI000A02F83E|nr:alpha/beta fold hydrolase [Henriciella aquimarina]
MPDTSRLSHFQPAAPGSGNEDASRVRKDGPAKPSACVSANESEETAFAWLDRFFRGASMRYAPNAPILTGFAAVHDWMVHMSRSPGHNLDLTIQAFESMLGLQAYVAHRVSGQEPENGFSGTRFRSDYWKTFPFDLPARSWLSMRDWWRSATAPSRGLNTWSNEHTAYWAELALEAMSPANVPFLNPDVIHRTLEESGENLQKGWQNWLDDMRREIGGRPPPPHEGYEVGKDLAITPGKVVYQNDLIELIQYGPTTDTVAREPVLMVPAWIMKYYILDLSPHNSLVRWLVSEGFQVFMVSWKNPHPEDAHFRLNDYLDLGIGEALNAVNTITGEEKVHACGYCLGGTLLSMQAARMARDGDHRLSTLSLLAAQTDFTEPGDIRLLVDEAQVTYLEDMMELEGVMPARMMSDGFRALRPDSQIWDPAVKTYLLGERPPIFDILAWNEDATRMPSAMMSDYLRGLYLDNDLASSRYKVDGRAISISDIRAPIFAVGTNRDHVAPWKSVFKITHLARPDVTFVLADGGHNAGIVTEPGHPKRHHKIGHTMAHEHHLSPEAWEEAATQRDGSWWLSWRDWLKERSGEPRRAQKRYGYAKKGYPVVRDAPGLYVLDR